MICAFSRITRSARRSPHSGNRRQNSLTTSSASRPDALGVVAHVAARKDALGPAGQIAVFQRLPEFRR